MLSKLGSSATTGADRRSLIQISYDKAYHDYVTVGVLISYRRFGSLLGSPVVKNAKELSDCEQQIIGPSPRVDVDPPVAQPLLIYVGEFAGNWHVVDPVEVTIEGLRLQHVERRGANSGEFLQEGLRG